MKVQVSGSVSCPVVTTDGGGLVSHGGLGVLAELADGLSGRTGALSGLMARYGHRFRCHDPREVVAQVVVAIADRAVSVTDAVGVISARSLLKGSGSYATVRRAIARLSMR